MKGVALSGSSNWKKKTNKEAPLEDNDKQKAKKANIDAALTEIDDLFTVAKTSKKEAAAAAAATTAVQSEAAPDKQPTSKVRKLTTSSSNGSSSNSSSSNSSSAEVDMPHGLLKSNVPRIIISPEAPVERIDKESGFKVYKAHLLKVGEGGGTPHCPFDCDCCF